MAKQDQDPKLNKVRATEKTDGSVVDDLRNGRANLVKSLFSNSEFSFNILGGVIPQLKKQFDPETKTEVGGAVDIDFETGRISFRAVETGFFKEVKAALNSFLAGKQLEAAPVLIKAIIEFTSDQPEEFKQKVINHEKSVFNRLNQLVAGEISEISEGSSRKITDIINIGLRHSYFTSVDELESHKREFVCSFHVHSDGTPPSDRDLANSTGTDFPDLVISAKPDFQTNPSISIYLVNNGGYEEVWSLKAQG